MTMFAFEYNQKAAASREAVLESTIVILGDALVSMLNIEGPAMTGAPEGLDVPYHFNKLREALRELEVRFPELHAAAFE